MKNEQIIKILIGTSASGKSTFTNKFLAENKNWVCVSRDSFRYMFRNQGWLESKLEDIISELMDISITKALNKNLNVIIDNTNLKLEYINHFVDLVKYKANVEFLLFDVPLEICLERDLNRERSVGESVIKNQYKQLNQLKKDFDFKPIQKLPSYLDRFVHLEQDKTLPEAVIFDIDGTLAIMGERSPYNWDKVDLDSPNYHVIEELYLHKKNGRKIIVLSGRDSICKDKTIEWLNKYHIHFDYLFMRDHNDNRKDSIIKKEIFEKNIKDKYYIHAIFDDRISVLNMWAKLGLFAFNVNNFNKEF